MDFETVFFAVGVAKAILNKVDSARSVESEGGSEVTAHEKAQIIADAANELLSKAGAGFSLRVVDDNDSASANAT